MKRCPRCDKTYPDSETFCEADGTALVSAGPAFSESAGNPAGGGAGEVIECPVCGGRAEPGELICNFCGARLPVSGGAEPTAAPGPARSLTPGGAVGSPRRRPETYVPAQDRLTATEFTPPIPPDDESCDE